MVRITPKDAQGLLDAYAKVHAPKEEPKVEKELGKCSKSIEIKHFASLTCVF